MEAALCTRAWSASDAVAVEETSEALAPAKGVPGGVAAGVAAQPA